MLVTSAVHQFPMSSLKVFLGEFLKSYLKSDTHDTSQFPMVSPYLYPAQAPKSHLGSAIMNGVSKTLLMSLSQLKILFGKFCYSSVVNAWLKFVKI